MWDFKETKAELTEDRGANLYVEAYIMEWEEIFEKERKKVISTSM